MSGGSERFLGQVKLYTVRAITLASGCFTGGRVQGRTSVANLHEQVLATVAAALGSEVSADASLMEVIPAPVSLCVNLEPCHWFLLN